MKVSETNSVRNCDCQKKSQPGSVRDWKASEKIKTRKCQKIYMLNYVGFLLDQQV